LALTEHALSHDFATRIAALAVHASTLALGGAAVAMARRYKSRARETLKKRHFCNGPDRKKRLPKSAHVLFSAPILIARLHSLRASHHK
jgi:hypothetical protein